MIDLAQDLTRTPIDVLNVNLLFIPFFHQFLALIFSILENNLILS